MNPSAGGGSVRRKVARLKALAADLGATAVVVTDSPEDGYIAARDAAAGGADALVAVGGDGTVHHVARAVIEYPDVALGIVPVGTGNDFAAALTIPSELGGALNVLRRGSIRFVDYGMATVSGGPHAATAPFFNVAGLGFDALAAQKATRYKWLPGSTGYTVAVLHALSGWKAPRATIRWDGSEPGIMEVDLLLGLVGNGFRAGGGFRMTPSAAIDDGMLDVCVVRDASWHRILRVLPTAATGRHIDEPEVTMGLVRTVEIETASPVPSHIDGEVAPFGVTKLTATVLHRGLRVIAP